MRTGVGPVAHRLERASGQARVGPRVCLEATLDLVGPGPQHRRQGRETRGRRYGVESGADRRAHAGATTSGSGSSPRAVTGTAALDQQGVPVGRRRSNRRTAPSPSHAASAAASGADSGCGSCSLSTPSSPSDRRRAGATQEMFPPGSKGSPTLEVPLARPARRRATGAARATLRPSSPSHATTTASELGGDHELGHVPSLPDRRRREGTYAGAVARIRLGALPAQHRGRRPRRQRRARSSRPTTRPRPPAATSPCSPSSPSPATRPRTSC